MQGMAPILNQLQTAREALLEMAERVSPERWRDAPRPGSWSAGEVIAHLWMVETTVVEKASKLTQAPAKPVPHWKRVHIPVRFAAWRGFRAKTPIPLDGNLVGEKAWMLEKFADIRKKTLDFVERNRNRDLRCYRYMHPFFGSLNLYDWLRMIAYHEMRHTQQLREIVEFFQK